jgi:hypothetical protein
VDKNIYQHISTIEKHKEHRIKKTHHKLTMGVNNNNINDTNSRK